VYNTPDSQPTHLTLTFRLLPTRSKIRETLNNLILKVKRF